MPDDRPTKIAAPWTGHGVRNRLTVSEPLLRVVDPPEFPVVVAFVEIAKAPRLLASLGSKIPSDIVPMPVGPLSVFCRRTSHAPVPLNGVVICVPENALTAEDRAILDDLGRLIPVLRIVEDPGEAGRTFFDRCREATPRTPRSGDRMAYHGPVVVSRAGNEDGRRLLLAGNVSPGGLFLRDPCPQCDPDELLILRFPGLAEVPELVGQIRWTRTDGQHGQPPGYGCAFDHSGERAARRLVAAVRSLHELDLEAPPPPGRRASPKTRGR